MLQNYDSNHRFAAKIWKESVRQSLEMPQFETRKSGRDSRRTRLTSSKKIDGRNRESFLLKPKRVFLSEQFASSAAETTKARLLQR
jgi:hypothetical protein